MNDGFYSYFMSPKIIYMALWSNILTFITQMSHLNRHNFERKYSLFISITIQGEYEFVEIVIEYCKTDKYQDINNIPNL